MEKNKKLLGTFTDLELCSYYFNATQEIEIIQTTIDKLGNGLKNTIQMTSLPSEIRYFANLTQMDLSYHNFSTFPPELALLTQLTKLNLFDGRQTLLTTLPKELSSNTSVRLNGNRKLKGISSFKQLNERLEATTPPQNSNKTHSVYSSLANFFALCQMIFQVATQALNALARLIFNLRPS